MNFEFTGVLIEVELFDITNCFSMRKIISTVESIFNCTEDDLEVKFRKSCHIKSKCQCLSIKLSTDSLLVNTEFLLNSLHNITGGRVYFSFNMNGVSVEHEEYKGR